MVTLVDANNLCGRLGIIQEKDFDKSLIEIIKEYLKIKNIHRNGGARKIILVFDSVDPLGDKYREEDLTVIYTPKDKYYRNADDKIIEIIDQSSEKIKVVSDDNEIIEAAEKRNCETEKTTEFIVRLDKVLNRKIDEIEDDDGLSVSEVEKINKELLKEWS